MNSIDLIQKILKASKPRDVFTGSRKKFYNDAVKLIHPDVCSHPKAEEAMMKLNEFKQILEKGLFYKDDAGTVNYYDFSAKIFGDSNLLKKSYDNYSKLISMRDKSSIHFRRYFPEMMEIKNNELVVSFTNRSIPLIDLNLPQEHVNWILSRMLELSAYFAQIGYCHAGINPESIYVVPETHGIICTSFYHMKRLPFKLNTVSAKYKTWYPASVFTDKLADINIDVNLAKRTAIYLLGDKSGNGISLKKTHNKEIIDFLITQSNHPYKTYDSYRALLRKHFDTKKFHELKI